jgi:hypothetical protein
MHIMLTRTSSRSSSRQRHGIVWTCIRLSAACNLSPPLLYHCSPFRGYSIPLLPATARPTGSSPTRSPSLSRQMKGFTVLSPSPTSRGRHRPCHTQESSRSTSLTLDTSVKVGGVRATRRRICRWKGESKPVPVGCEEDEVEFVSRQSRSRPKTKRPQIRFRRGSSPPHPSFSSPSLDAILRSGLARFDSSCCGPNLPF